MDYKSMKAPQLLIEIQKLEEMNANLSLQAQNAINIANWFAVVIEAIEKLLIAAPFINEKGKFFKKLGWIVLNSGKIIELIEEIFNAIKEWRKKVNELKATQQTSLTGDSK